MKGYLLGGEFSNFSNFHLLYFWQNFLSKIAKSFWFITFQELCDILKCFCKPHSFSARLLQSVKKHIILSASSPHFSCMEGILPRDEDDFKNILMYVRKEEIFTFEVFKDIMLNPCSDLPECI